MDMRVFLAFLVLLQTANAFRGFMGPRRSVLRMELGADGPAETEKDVKSR